MEDRTKELSKIQKHIRKKNTACEAQANGKTRYRWNAALSAGTAGLISATAGQAVGMAPAVTFGGATPARPSDGPAETLTAKTAKEALEKMMDLPSDGRVHTITMGGRSRGFRILGAVMDGYKERVVVVGVSDEGGLSGVYASGIDVTDPVFQELLKYRAPGCGRNGNHLGERWVWDANFGSGGGNFSTDEMFNMALAAYTGRNRRIVSTAAAQGVLSRQPEIGRAMLGVGTRAECRTGMECPGCFPSGKGYANDVADCVASSKTIDETFVAIPGTQGHYSGVVLKGQHEHLLHLLMTPGCRERDGLIPIEPGKRAQERGETLVVREEPFARWTCRRAHKARRDSTVGESSWDSEEVERIESRTAIMLHPNWERCERQIQRTVDQWIEEWATYTPENVWDMNWVLCNDSELAKAQRMDLETNIKGILWDHFVKCGIISLQDVDSLVRWVCTQIAPAAIWKKVIAAIEGGYKPDSGKEYRQAPVPLTTPRRSGAPAAPGSTPGGRRASGRGATCLPG